MMWEYVAELFFVQSSVTEKLLVHVFVWTFTSRDTYTHLIACNVSLKSYELDDITVLVKMFQKKGSKNIEVRRHFIPVQVATKTK